MRKRNAKSRPAETGQERQERLIGNRERNLRVRQTNAKASLLLAAFAYDSQYDYHLHPNVITGKMDVICQKCSAKKYRGVTPGMCCSSGKVKLTLQNEPPEPLKQYIEGNFVESRHFRDTYEDTIHAFKWPLSLKSIFLFSDDVSEAAGMNFFLSLKISQFHYFSAQSRPCSSRWIR